MDQSENDASLPSAPEHDHHSIPSDGLYDDTYAMGEMLRTLSSAYCDEADYDDCGDAPREDHAPVEEEEDFDDLFRDECGDEDVDLFERVHSSSEGDASTAVETFDSDNDDASGIAVFEDEADFLSSTYEGCRWNDRHNCFSIQVLRGDTLEFALERRRKKSSGVVINILRLRGYPNRAPEVCIEPWHNILTNDEVHQLYAHINAHCKMMEGNPSLLMSVVALATDLCDSMIRDGGGADCALGTENTMELKSLGLHIRAQHETLSPTQYVGSIGDLIGKLPKGVDVINVENILRPDLAVRFERMQRYFYQKYVASLEKRQETRHLRTQQQYLKLADVRPAFHGTRMVNVGKIVRSGLLVPGQATGIKVSTGSRYGCGIYSSPDPHLALCYAGEGVSDMNSVKLMICAVLMGKECIIPDGEEPWGGGCKDGFDSHISQDGKQYIVFHEAQILPCYVLHLMFRKHDESAPVGSQNTSTIEFATHARGTKSTAILTQIAKKNLPFGFGPKGSNFVVEEIAPYSDDEEDWGEFQTLRHGGGVGHEEYQHETLLPPPPPPAVKAPRKAPMKNPNRKT